MDSSSSPFSFSFGLDSASSPSKSSCSANEELSEATSASEASAVADLNTNALSVLSLASLGLNTAHLKYENVAITPQIGGNSQFVLKKVQVDHDRNNGKEEDVDCTDIIPGVYEGGFKTWECALDLCSYLLSSQVYSKRVDSDGRTAILELGCGHGLPGIMMLLQREDNRVLFSDYNDDVLQKATWPNILLNLPTEQHAGLFRSGRLGMVAGDWMRLSSRLMPSQKVRCFSTISSDHRLDNATPSTGCRRDEEPLPAAPPDGRFDIILAAETTYTESSARDTARLLSRHLKHDTGFALVATKRYYFGVGGGSDAFRSFANSIAEDSGNHEYRLVVETLQVYDNCRSNIRELLRVKLAPSPCDIG